MAQKKYTDGSGVAEIWANIKNYITAQLLSKADSVHTHTKNQITDFPSLSTVATSGSYNDLSNKPTIPTVNNATLTIQKNGTTVKTFTANASSNVTANITVPTKTSELTNDSGFLTSHQDLSGYVPRSGGAVMTGNRISRVDNTCELCIDGGRFFGDGATLTLFGKNTPNSGNEGAFWLTAHNIAEHTLKGTPNGTLTWGTKNVAMQEDTVPRSGGEVFTSNYIARSTNADTLDISGGSGGWGYGGAGLGLHGKNRSYEPGVMDLYVMDSSQNQDMKLFPNGTWRWTGTAVQITSDQRLKQQITEIDDKLLDAWEDVNLVQFKYNDAVDQKGKSARLHTGYVVQQIQKACESHGVDISQYGLFCHEEYPEETEEVEVEQADGTKTKERKVIREASEHYSLRYTEALIVECKYLRKCIKELRNEIEELKSSK